MVDPTSELGENITKEEAPRCVVCSERIQQRPTHHVVTRIKEGSVVTTHFCDDDCRSEWDR